MRKSELTKGEIGEFYRGYIDRLEPEAELVPSLKSNTSEFLQLLENIPEDKWDYRYAEGKWTLKEMIQHIIDTERIFQFRALAIARNEPQPLPGFDHDIYVLNSRSEYRAVPDLIKEYKIVREAGIILFESMTIDMLKLGGVMNDINASPRALGFMMVGHAMHHIEVIKEKYL
ncbi:DinB family protein [uncultured Christiangramia sp.]|uniref:DinB family protein n=1 Tax=uncultured Christiangramia sp. TaxID=503836 RepID=UPI002617C900|nr:DinB family protein [uncultured Christiangramia sp.]